MKGFRLLFGVYAKSYLGINTLCHSSDPVQKRKLRRQLILVCAVGVMMLLYAGIYFHLLGDVYMSLGVPEYILGIGCVSASIVTCISVLLRSGTALFAFSDFDTVNSLPLPVYTVVSCRVALLYISGAFFSLFIMLPAGVVYAQLVHPGVWFYVAYILTLPLVPLMPLVLAALIGTLISVVSLRFRRRSIVSIILTLLFICGIMVFSFNMQNVVENIDSIAPAMAKLMQRLWPPAVLYQNALTDSPVSAAAFIVMNPALIVLFIRVTGVNYMHIHSRLTSAARKKHAAARALGASSPLAALLGREYRRYFASVIYVTNTLVGLVLLLLACAALAVSGVSALERSAEFGELIRFLTATVPFFPALFAAMSVTTPPSFSLEGKRLWQLKVLPVEYSLLFKAKLLLSVTLALPFILISGALLCFTLKTGAAETLLTFLLPIAFAVFFGILGLYTGLRFPNLDWKSETEPVKQGVPLLITMFSGMLFSIGGIALCILSGRTALVSLLALALLAAGSVFVWRRLLTSGAERLRRL